MKPASKRRYIVNSRAGIETNGATCASAGNNHVRISFVAAQ